MDWGWKSQYNGCGKGCVSGVGKDPWEFRRLAINYPSWSKTNYFPDQPEGSLKGIWDLKEEEILFVVGDFEGYTRTRDIDFAVPSLSPVRIKNNCTAYDDEKPGHGQTWTDMANHVEGYMRDFQAQQAVERGKIRIEMEMGM